MVLSARLIAHRQRRQARTRRSGQAGHIGYLVQSGQGLEPACFDRTGGAPPFGWLGVRLTSVVAVDECDARHSMPCATDAP